MYLHTHIHKCSIRSSHYHHPIFAIIYYYKELGGEEGNRKELCGFFSARCRNGTTNGTDRSLYTQGLPAFKAASASPCHLIDTDSSMSLLSFSLVCVRLPALRTKIYRHESSPNAEMGITLFTIEKEGWCATCLRH